MRTDREIQEQAFSRLLAHFKVSEDGKGEVWTACPNCKRKQKDKKFSFSIRGFKCFICGFQGKKLSYLADFVRAPRAFRPYRHTEHRPKPVKKRPWQSNPGTALFQYTSHPRKVDRWRAYRPFSDEIIERYDLGVGVLPSCRCKHSRLIYPVYDGLDIVGFRGRAINCECLKWLVSAGTKVVLWMSDFAHYIEPGRTVIVCESPVDAMMVKMARPELVAVASTGGAGTWRDGWTNLIVSLLPAQVIVWLDNDLPGSAAGATRERLLAEWREKMARKNITNAHPPRANGPRIANTFLSHVPTELYRWPVSAPARMDLSDVLMGKAI